MAFYRWRLTATGMVVEGGGQLRHGGRDGIRDAVYLETLAVKLCASRKTSDSCLPKLVCLSKRGILSSCSSH